MRGQFVPWSSRQRSLSFFVLRIPSPSSNVWFIHTPHDANAVCPLRSPADILQAAESGEDYSLSGRSFIQTDIRSLQFQELDTQHLYLILVYHYFHGFRYINNIIPCLNWYKTPSLPSKNSEELKQLAWYGKQASALFFSLIDKYLGNFNCQISFHRMSSKASGAPLKGPRVYRHSLET